MKLYNIYWFYLNLSDREMKGKILVYNIKNRALPLKDWVYYKYMIFRSDAKSKNIRILQDLNMVHFYEGGGGREGEGVQ